MGWPLFFKASTLLFALLVGYLVLWRHLHRAPARGLRRLTGTLLGTEGELLASAGSENDPALTEIALGVELGLADGRAVDLKVGGATLRVLPGPAAPRRGRDLRGGDAVIVYGFDAPEGLQVLRVIRSGWREPAAWLEPAAAITALLAVVALSRTGVGELRVAETIPAGAPTLAQRPSPESLLELTRRMDRFYPFADGAAPPGELGQRQGFLEYAGGDPRTAEGERCRLYLQPIGPFSAGQQRGLRLASEFLARFLCLPVTIAEPLPLSEIPDDDRRVHAQWGIPQLRSTTIMHDLLRARLPRDAAGLLGVTVVDLWPGEGWHAVRGQASLVARVGIVSLYRSGLADQDAESFRLFLRRTLKLVVHEAGHLFSMWHCPNDACVMSGRNELEIGDRRHPLLCPDCLAKLVWATGCDPAERNLALARFCRDQGLLEEAALFQVFGAALRGW